MKRRCVVDYDSGMRAIIAGDLPELERLAATDDNFPAGTDPFLGRTWLRNAIDCGTVEVVKWMLAKGSPVNYEDDEGYPALHSAIDREKSDRYGVLDLLCAAGADVNASGLNDWTPLHMAAARNEVEAVKVLLRHGADVQARTRIDDYATPLEEARILGGYDAARVLKQFELTGRYD
jgi:ankyrin repeat protein